MEKHIKDLLHELEVLHESSEADYLQKQYSAYEHYLADYNLILAKLKSYGLFTTKQEIKPVPDGDKGYLGVIGSQAEVSKHREIINETKKLIGVLKPAEKKGTGNDFSFSKGQIGVIVGLVLTAIGGVYAFGKDRGVVDSERQILLLEQENKRVTFRYDSLLVRYKNLESNNQQLQNQLMLAKGEAATAYREEKLSKALENYISKAQFSTSNYSIKNFEDWKEEVLIILEKADKQNKSLKLVEFFNAKIEECESQSINFDPKIYKCGIEALNKVILKMD